MSKWNDLGKHFTKKKKKYIFWFYLVFHFSSQSIANISDNNIVPRTVLEIMLDRDLKDK